MKKILVLVFALVTLISNNSFANVDTEKATEFVKKVVNDGIEGIIDADISKVEKTERFRTLFNENLDLDFIGKFVLGRYWRTSTPKEKKDFIAAYRELNIKTWSTRFDDFKGKDFIFNNTTPSNSADQVFVNSYVEMGEGHPPAKVIWRVKQTDNNFKIVDIVIENVSLAITARNEYAAFIKNSSVSALVENLQDKIKNIDANNK